MNQRGGASDQPACGRRFASLVHSAAFARLRRAVVLPEQHVTRSQHNPAVKTRGLLRRIAVTVLLAVGVGNLSAQAPQLGRISFPTSETGPAQAAFLRGVLNLHNFEYDEAILAFREAQTLSPAFAMAYWGEALSYTQPLWYNENLARAREVLNRLAPTAAARLAKAPTAREKRSTF